MDLLIQGGLGNQLLQWVLASTLAAGKQREVRIDTTLMRSWSRSKRGLSQREISPLLDPADKIWHHWLLARARRRLRPLDRSTLTDVQLLAIASSEELLALTPDRLITHGTTPLLFEAPFKEQWLDVHRRLPRVRAQAGLGVHLRRGDYLNPASGFMAIPLSYYRRAIQRVFEQMPQLERRIVLFSDDPDWGQVHLNDASWELEIASGTPEEDLAAMATMRALVISNSSLSAIAAHLGESFGGLQLVICPDQWLSNPERKALGDLRKPSWISLPIQP
ncbi:alpha-1,2-fucosyltransferase [Synechococcus sp. A10-1-5-1]|uniref:alpha-1,2-fucosyltransferase n=1 Tax=Synechococcus sp. A10-1-5-1 TaxID=2936507 RepID=UPI00200086A2|nr:alpha-1,2-fucosyltransferase [Synechococcus sp. A10-1-5-1]UPM49195.1 alpha-1,2-fucosyltransferase [Synechococcus sp. A10-1-5-1]